MTTRVHTKQSEAQLEKQFINDYLKQHGQTRDTVITLPKQEYFKLMLDACKYASNKLAEMESRAKFVRAIHIDER